jgi:hypothetical protein
VAGDTETPSTHSVDRLIRALISTDRSATTEEIEQILEHLATAAFTTQTVRVPVKHRGLSYEGRVLGAREDSLFYHLVKRVLVEEQWAAGTTATEYLGDLRQAARSPQIQLVVYQRGGGHLAAVLAPTTVAPARQGAQPQPYIYLLYSADRGILITGYQASGLAEIHLPGDARWLR